MVVISYKCDVCKKEVDYTANKAEEPTNTDKFTLNGFQMYELKKNNNMLWKIHVCQKCDSEFNNKINLKQLVSTSRQD